LHEKKEVVLMKRMVVVLGVAAVMAAVVALTAGAALAQEESLPDLTVDKTGPSTATANEFVIWNIDVTNVGSGDAVLPSGTVLMRDNLRATGRLTSAGLGSGALVGVTGVDCFCDTPESIVHQTRIVAEWRNGQSPDAIISPGGGIQDAQVATNVPASGGHIINCATVDPDNVIVESNESNNTDCVTTKIVP
jgi:hypothetical protein